MAQINTYRIDIQYRARNSQIWLSCDSLGWAEVVENEKKWKKQKQKLNML